MDTKQLTPKELMISRYEAFVKEDWVYIAKTSINQTLEELRASTPIEWLKLDVVDAYDDIVEFKAYYRDSFENSKIHLFHEKSQFVKIDNEWKYLDGTLYKTSIQRNEICPCGSGKKYKKCCSAK